MVGLSSEHDHWPFSILARALLWVRVAVWLVAAGVPLILAMGDTRDLYASGQGLLGVVVTLAIAHAMNQTLKLLQEAVER